jgi:hypothetical protein
MWPPVSDAHPSSTGRAESSVTAYVFCTGVQMAAVVFCSISYNCIRSAY